MSIDEQTKKKLIRQANDIQHDEGGDWLDIFIWCYETMKAAKATNVSLALENAAEILVNFKSEGERTKLEEWQACYAMLFKQMNDLVNAKGATQQPLGSPVRYTDGTVSREYDEQVTQQPVLKECPKCGEESKFDPKLGCWSEFLTGECGNQANPYVPDVTQQPGELSPDDKVASELRQKLINHQAKQIMRMKDALKFYAKHEHWMEIAPESLRTSLVAMQGDGKQHGWRVAEDALFTSPKRESSCPWQPIETAPKDMTILVHYKNACNKSRVVKARYISKYTEENCSGEDWCDYNEATDTYYDREGWYEEIDNWDEYSHVAFCGNKPDSWQPLPKPPEITNIEGE